jgi:ubiquinone/menaquinone biosynthesis C-methylase UbiE
MAAPFPGFHEFELAGWEDADVVASYEREVVEVTRQSASALLAAGGVAAGARVLDVACGPGFMAAAAAAAGADAVGVDFSSAQVRAARRGHPGVRFEVGDAAKLAFPDTSFDAVLNGFGMLHLPDPGAAAREAWRVLVAGGRFAFSVWETPERAVAMDALMRAIRAFGDLNVAIPEGPDFFALSSPDRSRQLMLDAGFVEPEVCTVPQLWRLGEPDHVYDVFRRATVRMRALLSAQSEACVARIRAALRDELASYRRGEVYEVPMPALIVRGRKP